MTPRPFIDSAGQVRPTVAERLTQRAFDLDDVQPSLFGQDDRDLLADIAAQATEADYVATAELLRMARAHA